MQQLQQTMEDMLLYVTDILKTRTTINIFISTGGGTVIVTVCFLLTI